jgi:hypothetical protein
MTSDPTMLGLLMVDLHWTHPKARAACLVFNVGLPRAATRYAFDHQLA